jgi:hypothetical protein
MSEGMSSIHPLRFIGIVFKAIDIPDVTSQKVMVVIEKSLDTPGTSCYAHDV